MCISPKMLPDVGLVACRKCWRCRSNRVNDWVGRCCAEQQISSGALAVTLTYAGDTPNAAVLVYADFQKFMKRLRRDGYRVRYIVAGEYGSKKGRAHWHCILFFEGKVPDVAIEQRIDWKFWPHGFSYFQHPEYEGFAYILKYILKDMHSEFGQTHLSMSKKPPLGFEFFRELAHDYVKERLSPQCPEYAFAHLFDKKGTRRKFWLQGRMRELFCDMYLAEWQYQYGEEYPFSAFMEEHEDRLAASAHEMAWTDEDWARRLALFRAPMSPARRFVGKILVDLKGGYSFHHFPWGMVRIVYEDMSWLAKDENEAMRMVENLDLPYGEHIRAKARLMLARDERLQCEHFENVSTNLYADKLASETQRIARVSTKHFVPGALRKDQRKAIERQLFDKAHSADKARPAHKQGE